MRVLFGLVEPTKQFGSGLGGLFQRGQVARAGNDRKAGLRHEGVHQVVAVTGAEFVTLAHQHESGAFEGGEALGLIGAVAQGAGLAGEDFRAEGQGHVHTEGEDLWPIGAGVQVVRFHVVAQDSGEATGEGAGDLPGAVGPGGWSFGAGVGVEEG